MQLPNALEPRPRRMRGAGHGASTALVPAVILALTILAVLLTGQPVSAQTPSNDATLSALTVDGTSVVRFAADRTSYEFGVVHTTTQVTVLATPNDSGAMVGYAPTDADTTADGHQVDLTAGQNTVTIAVAAADGMTSATYTLNVNRGTDADYGWKAVDDLDQLVSGISAIGPEPGGIYVDATTIWVMERRSTSIHAYNRTDKSRVSARDIPLASGNTSRNGIWSDGTTIWVVDLVDDQLYAYDIASRTHQSDKDFDLHADNASPYAVWSDGQTLWVTDTTDNDIYVYDFTADTTQYTDTLDLVAPNSQPTGLWSDGATMWVSDVNGNRVYAYTLDPWTYDSSKDFDLVAASTAPRDLWSDGETMWVPDSEAHKVYSYNMPKSNVATLSNVTVDGRTPGSFAPDRASWEIGVAHDADQVTVEPTTTQRFATVAITPADASDTT